MGTVMGAESGGRFVAILSQPECPAIRGHLKLLTNICDKMRQRKWPPPVHLDFVSC
jgi:hypothetical protein